MENHDKNERWPDATYHDYRMLGKTNEVKDFIANANQCWEQNKYKIYLLNRHFYAQKV